MTDFGLLQQENAIQRHVSEILLLAIWQHWIAHGRKIPMIHKVIVQRVGSDICAALHLYGQQGTITLYEEIHLHTGGVRTVIIDTWDACGK